MAGVTTKPTTAAASATPAPLDLLRTHGRRFMLLSWLAIGVSYVHQADALLLFSAPRPLDTLAGLGMTAIIDLALWALGEFLFDVRRLGRRSRWALTTFIMATLVSIGLNFAYLITHKPPDEQLKEPISWAVAIVFAIFVPLLIAVSSVIRAQLITWQGEQAHAAATERSLLERLQAELASARAEAAAAVARGAELAEQLASVRGQAEAHHGSATEQARQIERLQAELADARAQATARHGSATAAEQRATVAAERAAEQARLATAAEQRATAAERQATEAQQRATAAERRAAELERAATAAATRATEAERRAMELPTRATVAERLRQALQAGATVASLARETGWKESTLRDMVAAV